MTSRANREARAQRTYGAPVGRQKPTATAREHERRRMLETEPTPETRRRNLEREVREGQEAARELRRAEGQRTEAPGPRPHRRIGEPGPIAEQIRRRPQDVQRAVEREQT